MNLLFKPERLSGIAMLCFGRDRLITVICNSPLHPTEVAIVELYASKESFEGAICLQQIISFAGLLNVSTANVYIREQSGHTIELWLFNHDSERNCFDDDPTPVDHLVDK